MNTFLLLKIFLESLLRDISAQLSMPNHYYQACKYSRQTMTGRIAISFPDVDANKSANNPNKPVHPVYYRASVPYSTGVSFASLSRVKPRIYRLRNPWREFYEARIYRKSGARVRAIEQSDPEFAR